MGSKTEELMDVMIGMTTDTNIEEINERLKKGNEKCPVCGKELRLDNVGMYQKFYFCKNCHDGYRLTNNGKLEKIPWKGEDILPFIKREDI